MNKEELVKLLNSMSLQEKIDQTLQISGSILNEDTLSMGPLQELGLIQENLEEVGFILGLTDPTEIIETQKKIMETQKHHIPMAFMLDVIHGFKTIFPIPLAQACSFSPDLVKKGARVAAIEASVAGIQISCSPMVDLVRDARWGRNMESYGEDPYLNSCYAQAMVEGYQQDSLSKKDSVSACVKHFAAYGAPVAGRDYNNVELSEHMLRQDYLPSYQAAINAGAGCAMNAFNTINGIPCGANQHLLRDILRNEMGFDGVLISDWASVAELVEHGFASDRKQAAKLSIEAGLDVDMMTGIYSTKLKELIEEKQVDEKLLDETVLRILELKNKLGLFENPFHGADPKKAKELFLCDAHRKLSLELAEKSFVLLENQDLLPLNPNQKIAFIGPYVSSLDYYSSWVIAGNKEDVINIEMAAKKWNPIQYTFDSGCNIVGDDVVLEAFSNGGSAAIDLGNASEEEKQKMKFKALQHAKESEVVVMALGEHTLQAGEACSKAEITIPDVQMELLKEVYQVNKNIVVVLFNGRPLDLRQVKQNSKAILEVWRPGTMGGEAILNTLFGKNNPSGKCTMSFPYSVGQVPVYYNEYKTGRIHQPGKDKDKFRSKYLDIPNAPLYPFGYGLSYTSFEISPITLNTDSLVKDTTIKATVTVKNTGKVEGETTVQLYIHDCFASVVRAVKELKGFKKVTLKPNESKEIEFVLNEEMLRFVNQNYQYVSEAGEFELYIGLDSTTENKTIFTLLD